jgi:hypothetical protein
MSDLTVPEVVLDSAVETPVNSEASTPEVKETESKHEVGSPEDYEAWLRGKGAVEKRKETIAAKKEAKANEPVVPAAEEPKVEVAKETANEKAIKALTKDDVEPEVTKVPESVTKDEPKVEAAPASVKVKIDGVEKDVSIEDLKAAYGKDQSSAQRFAEAAKIKANTDRLLDTLKTNPGAVLNKLGVTREQIEDMYFEQFLEPEINPIAAKARALEKELNERRAVDSEREAQAVAAQKEVEAQEHAKAVEAATVRLHNEFNEALSKEGLPVNDFLKGRMGAYMAQAFQEGHTHVNAMDVVKLVKQEWAETNKNLMTQLDPEALIATLGDDVVEKIRQHQVAKATQTKFQSTTKEPEVAKRVKPEDKPKRKTFSSIYDMLDE